MCIPIDYYEEYKSMLRDLLPMYLIILHIYLSKWSNVFLGKLKKVFLIFCKKFGIFFYFYGVVHRRVATGFEKSANMSKFGK